MQYEHSSMREYTGKRKNREVLCEKALKLYEEKFKDGTSIGTFHQEKDENVFLDSKGDRIRFNWGRSFFEKNTSPIESVL